MAVRDRWHRWVRREDGTREKVRSAEYGCSRRWQVRWRDEEGRQRKKNFSRQPDAKSYDADTRSALDAGTYIDPKAGKVTFRSYAEDWLKSRTVDAATLEGMTRHLRKHAYPTLGHRPLRALRPSTLQAWLSGLQLEASTVGTVYSTVSAVLSAAVDDRLIPENPCKARSVKPPRGETTLIEPWPKDQVLAVAKAMPDQYAAAVWAAAGLGSRQGEVFGLAVEDVDWLRSWVHVRRQVKFIGKRPVFAPPKGRRSRHVPLSEPVKLELATHLESYPARSVTLPWVDPDGEPVTAKLMFTSAQGGALLRQHFNKSTWKPALRAAGVPATRDNGMHALRHYFASVLLDGGESIRAVADYLGHTDPGFTLRIYAHLMPASEERTRRAVARGLTGDGSERKRDVP